MTYRNNQADTAEIHALQNELTQQLGVSAHNLAVSEFFVTARRLVGYGQDEEAINAAMDALRKRIAEIRRMGRMERAGLGMPKRQAPVPLPTPKAGFAEVQAEVKALGGFMSLASDSTDVQLVGCSFDQLSPDARFAMKYFRESFVQCLKRASGML